MIHRKQRNSNKSPFVLQELRARLDNWSNIMTGLGYQSNDKRLSTLFTSDGALTETELNGIFRNDGMGRRVIEVINEDLHRKIFTVKGDTDGLIAKELKKIKAIPRIIEASKWALLHGGAVGIVGLDDGGYYNEPVNEKNINRVTHVHIFDRWRAIWTTADLYQDPSHPKYATPQWYTIFPINPATIGNSMLMYGTQRNVPTAWGQISGQQPRMQNYGGTTSGDNPHLTGGLQGFMSPGCGAFRCHESRVMRFDAPLIPLRERIRNRYWNDSYLQSGYSRIRGLGEGYCNIETILEEFIIGTLGVENLANLLAEGEDSTILSRLSAMDRSKHIMNTLLLDKEETYSRNSANVSGLKDLMDTMVQACAMSYGVPVTRLMGESPAGLNATGAADTRNYYDKIAAMQGYMLPEPLEKLIRYIMLSKDSAFKGKEIKDWEIDFPSLWETTETEEADKRLKVAQTDAIYLDRGVITPEECKISRFGGNSYSIETKISNEEQIKQEQDLMTITQPVEEEPQNESEQPDKSEPSKNAEQQAEAYEEKH